MTTVKIEDMLIDVVCVRGMRFQVSNSKGENEDPNDVMYYSNVDCTCSTISLVHVENGPTTSKLKTMGYLQKETSNNSDDSISSENGGSDR